MCGGFYSRGHRQFWQDFVLSAGEAFGLANRQLSQDRSRVKLPAVLAECYMISLRIAYQYNPFNIGCIRHEAIMQPAHIGVNQRGTVDKAEA